MNHEFQSILVWIIVGIAVIYLLVRGRKKKGCGSKDSCCGTSENKIVPKSSDK